MNVTQKLLKAHLVSGELQPGQSLGIRIDQTLTQDATGTLVMLELEAMGLDRVATELSVQYVDHNLIQADYKNPDDHLFLRSACRRFGVWFSRPGNGVSHPVHQEHFGRPGRTLLGSDSHTCAAGAMGMLAIGAGGLDVAMAMAGQPYHVRMPRIWGIRLVGELSPWVSAKDVILELLRRHGVSGGVGRVLEYHGPGLAGLDVWDRHVIANMGTELGATTSVFPGDEQVWAFMRRQGREREFEPVNADEDATYDDLEEIDLSQLEPLVALPSSPGNVHPVRELAGEPIYQAYIGSSANPGYRDFAIAAAMVDGRTVHERVSFDINPASRQILGELARDGHLLRLVRAGGRVHQTGCNGCIGMGQAPASGRISLRTVPRNFPGRSGTPEDAVYLVSPETAAASALRGEICDPRDLGIDYPVIEKPAAGLLDRSLFSEPLPLEQASGVELVKGPNIKSLPPLEPLPDELELRVLLQLGDDISTDEILPAGARVLPYRSNIDAISQFAFEGIDPGYPKRARASIERGGHAIVAGDNYGQGSSREHAALAPRALGLRLVIARSFARIHRQNLINFGVLVLTLDRSSDERPRRDSVLRLRGLRAALERGAPLVVHDMDRDEDVPCTSELDRRERELLLAGGLINRTRDQLDGRRSAGRARKRAKDRETSSRAGRR